MNNIINTNTNQMKVNFMQNNPASISPTTPTSIFDASSFITDQIGNSIVIW